MNLCTQTTVLRDDVRLAVAHRGAGQATLRVICSGLTAAILAAGTTGTTFSQDSPSAVMIREVQADGQPLNFSAEASPHPAVRSEVPSDDGTQSKRLRISAQARRLDFRFGPDPDASNPPVRFRYRLDGFDEDWREAGGEMRLAVKFLDSAGNTVSASDFEARGESPGWSGNGSDSRFVQRREQVTVPPGVVWVLMELFSGGDEKTTGIMMIDELRIARLGSTNARPETVLFSSRVPVGANVDQLLGVPRHWVRDGSKPTIAQVLKVDMQAPRHVLAVVDTDSRKWGAWRASDDSLLPVHPGEVLELRWNEMYSIGWGDIREASYTYLPPGEYRFRVKAVTETGAETGEMTSLAITVLPRFWKTGWFLGVTSMVAVGALVASVRYLTGRKLQSRLELVERLQAVERERARIARDLHDDLGASLTQIALLSELAKADLDDPDLARTHLNQIFTTAGGLARHLNEIVWTVNPANDTLEQFTSFICKFAQHYLGLAGLRCRLDFPDFLPSYLMLAPERHSLLLATKEALHNIVKHAEAGQVWLRLRLDADVLTLLIEDDGKGSDAESAPAALNSVAGDGLSNMRQRMDQVGGRFSKQSRPGGGTIVRLGLPLRKDAFETHVNS